MNLNELWDGVYNVYTKGKVKCLRFVSEPVESVNIRRVTLEKFRPDITRIVYDYTYPFGEDDGIRDDFSVSKLTTKLLNLLGGK